MRQISVGSNSVWGVSGDGRVLARIGISDESPTGREWSTVDADSMKHVITFWLDKISFWNVKKSVNRLNILLINIIIY